MSSNSIAVNRLRQERKNWRKDHPQGFWARPDVNSDSSMNLLKWVAGIPGKVGTDWEGGTYQVHLFFTEDYPSKAPQVKFSPPLYHPNVYMSGQICLSILEQDWKASITIKQILCGIQELLDNPNKLSPAQQTAYSEFCNQPAVYKKKVLALAKKCREKN